MSNKEYGTVLLALALFFGLGIVLIITDYKSNQDKVLSPTEVATLKEYVIKDKAIYAELNKLDCAEVQKYDYRYENLNGVFTVDGKKQNVVGGHYVGSTQSIWVCPDKKVFKYDYDIPNRIYEFEQYIRTGVIPRSRL